MISTGIVSDRIARGQVSDRRSEEYREKYWSLFEQSGLCMANLDLRLRILEANYQFTQKFGRCPSTVRGLSIFELLHPSVQGRLSDEFCRLTEGHNPRFADHMMALGPRNTLFLGELTGVAVPDGAGKVDTIIVLIRPEAAEAAPREEIGSPELLSPMEARIVEGVAAGDSTPQLAAKLFLSRGGVEYHVTALLRRMGVVNRPALISKAYSLGFFRVSEWPPRVRPEYVSSA